ncbi:MAG: transcription-repair coupling factor [Muribaculaceae bacterium]|nr:transcription-repair coupling factor [Muribaculaceae bacterium]
MTKTRTEALRKALSKREVALCSLAGSAPAMMLAGMPETGAPVLVVGEDEDDAGYLFHDLTKLLGEDVASVFPSGYKRHIKYGQPDAAAQILRTETLNRIMAADPALRFVVTYPEALAEKVASADDIKCHTLQFSVGARTKLDDAEKWLFDNGFVQQDYVYEPGQFAIRGSILDIFGYNNDLPYRIDFFGDEIDSMRTFNIETQLSEQRLQTLSITSNLMSQSAKGTPLIRILSEETIIAVRNNEYTLARIAEVTGEEMSSQALISGEGDMSAMEQLVDAEDFKTTWAKFRRIEFSAAPAPEHPSLPTISFNCSPQTVFHKNFDLIADSLRRYIQDGYRIFLLSDSEKQHERIHTIFKDRGDSDIEFTSVLGTLHEGFIDNSLKIAYLTDHQIFDRYHKYTLKSDRARSGKLALSLKELSAIEPGDYIVHVDHGIGRFAGLLRTQLNGSPQEMIKLVYANEDIIFVSIHSLHKLAKYRGKEGVPPKINRLGSGAWNRLKERTKERLKDIARDLIQLYAKRRNEPGHAFAPDSYLQHELEASFIYEDTPDQVRAIRDVKADMESTRPMDRLICGDVGFGKTEVAIRAAFKAAVDGKQTAVLVPTTVLAYQHYNTFSQRLKDFPVRVDYLSRARTPAQVKAILADLAEGKIDILIGTHKLIGKSVKFKDLGLLVIDEEQKFGVAVKEKLRQMKVNVDTLTMTATPIPRTLQFSLLGARDLSAIITPPANRQPIVTSVNALSDDIVAEAINFEVSRGGQVFIINNRIEGLLELEAMVKRLVPNVRTIVAHGQMSPEKLEKSIMEFAAHDYDVLIATTIIENGVDMPNVNTVIVNNAQRFGLSELHQIRGRVGRSSRKAFCYLLVPPRQPLSPVSRRRLQAIESFSDLGSGIHIAMQDLDIRGAGNLLGAEQSGFIADLGYETYQKILQEAVSELRMGEFADVFEGESVENEEEGRAFANDCMVESDLELLLPANYVPTDSERVALYRELDEIERETDLQNFKTKLEDRFGKIPQETAELLRVPRLRRLARGLGIEKVTLRSGKMYIYFVDESNVAYYQSNEFGKLLEYLQNNSQRVKIRGEHGGKRSFVIDNVTTTETAVAILTEIKGLQGV